MKRTILAASLGVLLAFPAFAQMPPSTYSDPLSERIVAQARCVVTSIKDGGVVLPQFLGLGGLRAGQYRNPTTCAVEGAPTDPRF